MPGDPLIAAQRDALLHQVMAWSAINSGSAHPEGLARMLEALSEAFRPLGGEEERISLAPMPVVNDAGILTEQPLGQALRIRKRPDAPLRVLLAGHMDTVFGREHVFQIPHLREDGTLHGPGVADMKGGIAVLLAALSALEASPMAEKVGWEVLINPDEEIGSIGSRALFEEAARRNQVGLLYEPSMPDGALVSSRKGSGNFTLVVRGRAAHAGRDFTQGKNAVALLAECVGALHGLNGQQPGVTVNCARVRGGEALNVVPDLAQLGFNVRVADTAEQRWVEERIGALVEQTARREGFAVELHGGFTRPPKPVNEAMRRVQALVESCAAELGMPLSWNPSGGCCDGNNLAAAGLPNVDTLGVRGGNIHSDREYLVVDSLVERAQLSALLLMRLAEKEGTPG
jgi:glutamate carboxypeptidase